MLFITNITLASGKVIVVLVSVSVTVYVCVTAQRIRGFLNDMRYI